MIQTVSAEEPARVLVEAQPGGMSCDVWLRGNIEQDAADNGPEGAPYEFWRADEAHLVVAGSITVEEAEARFDELWAQAEQEGMTDSERIVGVEQIVSALADTVTAAKGLREVVSMAFSVVPASDEQALANADYYPEWRTGQAYAVGQIAKHGASLYRCAQAHTSQADWEPGAAASLWSEVSYTDSGVEEWRQPTGAHDAYAKGAKVSHNGAVYVSLVDANVWEPGAAGSETLWEAE